MGFHPSQIPIMKTFIVKDEKAASDSAAEIVSLGFEDKKGGYKILMPKEERIAKRIGFAMTTEITYRLKQTKQDRNVRYWAWHHDDENYAIVFISHKVFDELGL
ncbi:MAG: hypothetical protein ACT4NT_05350 [Nitrososphaerota archaeon]